jgi:polyphosphate kinase 2 (PPK2 family)
MGWTAAPNKRRRACSADAKGGCVRQPARRLGSGAIQRLIEKLNPRWVQVWSVGRPSPEEQGRHYLWRFGLPLPGNITIFDRTWYGRVLVERVEGLARPKEWRRAHDEVNAFEKMLVDDGIRLVKLFLHMSDEEQLRRFRERVITPTKHWKMTAEDIRNRARRREYLAALDDMFALTSTAAAPWYVVRRNINGTHASP